MKTGRASQGLIWRMRLDKEGLTLWCFGILPLGRVRLDRVVSLNKGSRRDFYRWGWHRGFCWWRYWNWPGCRRYKGQRCDTFVIALESGTRIWLAMRPGFHYQIREKIHLARQPQRDAAGVSLESGPPPRLLRPESDLIGAEQAEAPCPQ